MEHFSYDEDDLRVAETDPSVLVHVQTVEAAKRDLSFLRLQYLDPSSPVIRTIRSAAELRRSSLGIRREEVVLRNLRADIRVNESDGADSGREANPAR